MCFEFCVDITIIEIKDICVEIYIVIIQHVRRKMYPFETFYLAPLM